MELTVDELTAEAFAPFGHVIDAPDRDPDATGPGWAWWAETASLAAGGRAYGVGLLRLEPAELRFDWAERHMRSPELVVPANGDCLVYVGPPDHPDEPGRLPDLERFRVFRVPAGRGVLLAPGVWHGAPLALDAALQAVVLLPEGTGRDDTTVVRFPGRPIGIQA